MRKNASSKYAHGVTATVAAKCAVSPRAENGKRREQAASAKNARTATPIPAESNASCDLLYPVAVFLFYRSDLLLRCRLLMKMPIAAEKSTAYHQNHDYDYNR